MITRHAPGATINYPAAHEYNLLLVWYHSIYFFGYKASFNDSWCHSIPPWQPYWTCRYAQEDGRLLMVLHSHTPVLLYLFCWPFKLFTLYFWFWFWFFCCCCFFCFVFFCCFFDCFCCLRAAHVVLGLLISFSLTSYPIPLLNPNTPLKFLQTQHKFNTSLENSHSLYSTVGGDSVVAWVYKMGVLSRSMTRAFCCGHCSLARLLHVQEERCYGPTHLTQTLWCVQYSVINLMHEIFYSLALNGCWWAGLLWLAANHIHFAVCAYMSKTWSGQMRRSVFKSYDCSRCESHMHTIEGYPESEHQLTRGGGGARVGRSGKRWHCMPEGPWTRESSMLWTNGFASGRIPSNDSCHPRVLEIQCHLKISLFLCIIYLFIFLGIKKSELWWKWQFTLFTLKTKTTHPCGMHHTTVTVATQLNHAFSGHVCAVDLMLPLLPGQRMNNDPTPEKPYAGMFIRPVLNVNTGVHRLTFAVYVHRCTCTHIWRWFVLFDIV